MKEPRSLSDTLFPITLYNLMDSLLGLEPFSLSSSLLPVSRCFPPWLYWQKSLTLFSECFPLSLALRFSRSHEPFRTLVASLEIDPMDANGL